ncbi:unnamed protein product [Discosporangium mesarthrocarpum]
MEGGRVRATDAAPLVLSDTLAWMGAISPCPLPGRMNPGTPSFNLVCALFPCGSPRWMFLSPVFQFGVLGGVFSAMAVLRLRATSSVPLVCFCDPRKNYTPCPSSICSLEGGQRKTGGLAQVSRLNLVPWAGATYCAVSRVKFFWRGWVDGFEKILLSQTFSSIKIKMKILTTAQCRH